MKNKKKCINCTYYWDGCEKSQKARDKTCSKYIANAQKIREKTDKF